MVPIGNISVEVWGTWLILKSSRYPLMSSVGLYLLGDLESVENEVTGQAWHVISR
jgi:hypothetical protein